jgi:hypothetical protein
MGNTEALKDLPLTSVPLFKISATKRWTARMDDWMEQQLNSIKTVDG